MGIVIGIVGVTIAVQALLRRRFLKVIEGKQNDVLVFGFAVVRVVYAIIMGFLIGVLVAGNIFLITELAFPYLGFGNVGELVAGSGRYLASVKARFAARQTRTRHRIPPLMSTMCKR